MTMLEKLARAAMTCVVCRTDASAGRGVTCAPCLQEQLAAAREDGRREAAEAIVHWLTADMQASAVESIRTGAWRRFLPNAASPELREDEVARLRRELDAAVEYHEHCGRLIEDALGSDVIENFDGDRYHRFAASIRRLRDTSVAQAQQRRKRQ